MSKLTVVIPLILLCTISSGSAQDFHPPMLLDQATYQEWVSQFENAPEPYIDPTFSSTPGSYNLLDHLKLWPQSQGSCSNCWAFAGTACLGIALDVQKGILDDLSVQYINSCREPMGYNCCRGSTLEVFCEFYSDTLQAIPSSNFNAGWQDWSNSCDTDCSIISKVPSYPIASINAETIPTHNMDQSEAISNIKNLLHQEKAVWLALFFPSTDNWDSFTNFWYYQHESIPWDHNTTCGQIPDRQAGHAVLCVGYNDEDPTNRYWIILNSWGSNTNRSTGLFRLKMDMNYSCQFSYPSGCLGYTLYWQTLNVSFDTSVDPTPTPSTPEPTPPTPEPTPEPIPKVSLGGYLDSVIITYPDKTCGRINALMNVQNQGVTMGEAGLTMLPADPWQMPEIIWPFDPVAGTPGYFSRYGTFAADFGLPENEPLVFGMAAKDQDGNHHTHHWPFVPVKPDSSNNTPPGVINWQESLIQVPGAVPNQQILSAYQESVQQLQALGAGPGAKPIIWQAGYLETDLTVGQPGTLQIGLIVTKDQDGTDIDQISVLSVDGQPLFSLSGPGTYQDGFYFFFAEWALPICPNMPSPYDWFWSMRVINVDGNPSFDWPNVTKILPNEAAPVISTANFGDSCCHLTWFQDNRIEVSSFVVNWVNLDDQTTGSSGPLDYTQTSYLITGLDNCDTYQMTVTAIDLCINDDLVSEPVTGKPSVEPVPQNMQIAPSTLSPSGFAITWSPTTNGIYAVYEGYSQNPEDLTFLRFCTTTSSPQPPIQDIVKYFAVRSCISTKQSDLEYAGCFSNVVRGRKLPSGVGVIHNLKLIDLSNDGIDDLVLSTESGILQIYFGQPDDSWVLSGQVFPVPVKDFSLFDFNKDGSIDIAIAGINAIRTYFNSGSGTMSVSETVLPSGENKVIESDDLDNKGTSDVVVGNSEGTIIKVNDETGLTDEFQYLESGDTSVLLAADLTGDARKEVVTATVAGENIIWIKDAEGLYVNTNQNVYTWGTQSIKAIDMNLDGCMDLIVTDGYDQDVVFMNDCNGNFTLQ